MFYHKRCLTSVEHLNKRIELLIPQKRYLLHSQKSSSQCERNRNSQTSNDFYLLPLCLGEFINCKFPAHQTAMGAGRWDEKMTFI